MLSSVCGTIVRARRDKAAAMPVFRCNRLQPQEQDGGTLCDKRGYCVEPPSLPSVPPSSSVAGIT